ncbi:TetR family transcriptional regulator [Aliidongia dinghuensis]|uniref:TetR family transcriptional regulator n=1 Tax=Aliidongia dinghuensis TaxID=1867774 RepID=A0A8J3E3W6_9PROT|nr:TetR/AcrR family transcriptional regulator [Aliidongia dinghuensis]GGF19318.1 TetR family transcriptional regulator [Aliidongia dinghuensis]
MSRRPKSATLPSSDGFARSDNRRTLLLDEAARLFGARGYDSTSMRDIATAVGMLPGSLYYHFPSKEDLLVAVYTIGIDQMQEAVLAAVARESDPWKRLEAAAAAHLSTLLDTSGYAAAVVADWPSPAGSVRDQLVRQRDRYEETFRELVADLPLGPHQDRQFLRLALLGALNWSLAWYKSNGDSPETIARRLVAQFRAD